MNLRFVPAATIALAIGCGQPAPSTDQADAEPATEQATAAAFNPDDLPTIKLDVPAIHCEVCATGVTAALEEQPGVMDVSVDVDSKTATVAVDEAQFDADAAIAALDAAEFTGSTVEAPDKGAAAPVETGQEG